MLECRPTQSHMLKQSPHPDMTSLSIPMHRLSHHVSHVAAPQSIQREHEQHTEIAGWARWVGLLDHNVDAPHRVGNAGVIGHRAACIRTVVFVCTAGVPWQLRNCLELSQLQLAEAAQPRLNEAGVPLAVPQAYVPTSPTATISRPM